MARKLLVRIYNVGLGDCIYVRVPDGNDDFHLLIDCGNTYADEEIMAKALENLITECLPKLDSGKHQLDLLVVTHPHQDHIAGFDKNLNFFQKMEIKNLWMSVSFNPCHPQYEKGRNLQAFSKRSLKELSNLGLSPSIDNFVTEMMSLSNEPALANLRYEMGVDPLYVHDTKDLPELFSSNNIRLLVLGPVYDIDGEYLGWGHSQLNNFIGMAAKFSGDDSLELSKYWHNKKNYPKNISSGDFRRLRERLFINALAFVKKNNELINNTSVILLLEWEGRRLLFTGDAQCHFARDGKYKEGEKNGGWNVLWENHKEEFDPEHPLDFWKIGHHGSINATPYVHPEPGKFEHPVNEIFNQLLPQGRDDLHAIISTQRRKYPSIPDKHLMEELGRRVAMTRTYDEEEFLKSMEPLGGEWEPGTKAEVIVSQDVQQPLRTDLEYQYNDGNRVPFIDIVFNPAPVDSDN